MSRLHHPGVLACYGMCSMEQGMFLVSEFCPMSVLGYLQSPDTDKSPGVMLTIAVQVARVRDWSPYIVLWGRVMTRLFAGDAVFAQPGNHPPGLEA